MTSIELADQLDRVRPHTAAAAMLRSQAAENARLKEELAKYPPVGTRLYMQAHIDEFTAEIERLKAVVADYLLIAKDSVAEITSLRAELAAIKASNSMLYRRNAELVGVESELAELRLQIDAEPVTTFGVLLSHEEARRLLDDIYRGIGCLSYASAESSNARDSLVDALTLIRARLAAPVQPKAKPVQKPVDYSYELAAAWHAKDVSLYLHPVPPSEPKAEPADDLTQALTERDEYHDMADQLADQIAAITEADIGEHSSGNSPWHNAMLAADEFIAKRLLKALLAQPKAEPSEQKGLFIDLIAELGGLDDAVQPKAEPQRPQNCGTGFCSCIECVMDKPTVKESLTVAEPVQEPVDCTCAPKDMHFGRCCKSPVAEVVDLESTTDDDGNKLRYALIYEFKPVRVGAKLYTVPPSEPKAEPAQQYPAQWAAFLHYPEHWDTAAYPTLQSAIHEALAWSGCSACKAEPVQEPSKIIAGPCGQCGSRKDPCYCGNVNTAGSAQDGLRKAAQMALEWFESYSVGAMSRNNAENLAIECCEALHKELGQ